MASGGTPAIDAVTRRGITHQVHRYDHDPAVASYGQEAADALGVDAARVHKTLIASADDRLVTAVVPVNGSLDLKALAAAAGAKRAVLAPTGDAERAAGSVVGAISPLGLRRRLPVIVDAAAADWPTIFVSAGRRGVELELSAGDLVAAVGGQFAPIARLGGSGLP